MKLPLSIAITATILVSGGCGGSSEPPPAEHPGAPDSTPMASQQSEPEAAPPPMASARGDAAALPPGHPPLGSAPTAPAGAQGTLMPPPPGSGSGSRALAWQTPEGWVEETPSSPMRKAQYRVPGPGGDAECVVFYFGPGQGGSPQANVERWAGQFTLPDGSPAMPTMKTGAYEEGEVRVTTVEVTGTYDGGQTMTAKPPKPQPGSMLLGAIAEGPDANWFFKFTGPEATVKAQRAAFDAMVRSLKRGA